MSIDPNDQDQPWDQTRGISISHDSGVETPPSEAEILEVNSEEIDENGFEAEQIARSPESNCVCMCKCCMYCKLHCFLHHHLSLNLFLSCHSALLAFFTLILKLTSC